MKLNTEKGIRGTVYGTEYLGNRKICTIDTKAGQLKVRITKDQSVSINDPVQVSFPPEAAILFNGQSEKALMSDQITN